MEKDSTAASLLSTAALDPEDLGQLIASFRHSHFRAVFTCLITGVMIFIFHLISKKSTDFLVATICMSCVAGPYVYSQLKSRLALHEHGLRFTGWLTQTTLIWSDIAFRSAHHSVIRGSPNTVISLSLTRKNGEKVTIPNNWRPSSEFEAFLRWILDGTSFELRIGTRLQKSDIFVKVKGLPPNETLKMLAVVAAVFFFPIGIALVVLLFR